MRLGTLVAVLAVAACGKSASLTDAPSTDGNGADAAAAIDADLHGVVTVTVYDPNTGAVAPGIQVAFVEPGGSIAAEVMTDANGVASASVVPGASVTAGYLAYNFLSTVLGVKPGDHITINPYGPPGGSTPVGTFHVVVPDDGDSSYAVVGPCGRSNPIASAGVGMPTTVDLDLYSGCQAQAMDLIAIGNNSDGNPEAWVHLAGVAYTDGGTATMPATGWSPMLSPVETFDNVSTDITGIRFTDWVPDDFGVSGSDAASATTTTTITLFDMPGAATALFYSAFVGPGSGRDLFDVVDGATTTHTIDASTELLPAISVPTLDPATGAVHVAMSAAPAGAAQYTDLYYARTVDAGAADYLWEVVSAPATDFTLPNLPTDLAPLGPAVGDLPGNDDAGLNDSTTIKTWDDARADALNAFEDYYAGRAPIGRMRASYTTSGADLAPRSGGRGRHQRAARIGR